MVLANRSFSSIFYYYYVFKYRSLDVVEEGVQSAREREIEREGTKMRNAREQKKKNRIYLPVIISLMIHSSLGHNLTFKCSPYLFFIVHIYQRQRIPQF